MQPRPFLSHVSGGIAVEQVVQLAGIALDIVELILKSAAVQTEIDCIGPVALADRPDVAARDVGREKKRSSNEKIVWSCTRVAGSFMTGTMLLPKA